MSAACLSDELIQAVGEGRARLGPAELGHVAQCDDCRVVLAAVARGAGERSSSDARTPFPEDEPSWNELGTGVVIGGGAYVLRRFLGAGGMGVVWAAERVVDRVPVAIKIARRIEADDKTAADLARRFEREARIAGALDHPNVVRVLDVLPATRDRGPCIVQELVDGETLERRLARELRVSVRDAARVLLPVTSALDAAHGRGIVHRDIKPSNIIVSLQGRIVVLDFGIAKLTASAAGQPWASSGARSALTPSGAVVGTPRYMAPEQVFGETDVDARADVWALGALLYRMLTGHDAVDVEGPGSMMRRLRDLEAEGRTSMIRAPAHVPPNVAWLLEGAMTIRREDRLKDVRPFLAVLSTHAR